MHLHVVLNLQYPSGNPIECSADALFGAVLEETIVYGIGENFSKTLWKWNFTVKFLKTSVRCCSFIGKQKLYL